MKQIELTKGYSALVDDEDYEMLSKHKWCAAIKRGGVVRPARRIPANTVGRQRSLLMHRFIMNVHGKSHREVTVDHINGNTLDNRRSNLRLCSPAENSMNRHKDYRKTSSVYKGVSLKRKGLWSVTISLNKKKHFLGYFVSETDAAKAYDEAALRLHGTYAKLNFPI